MSTLAPEPIAVTVICSTKSADPRVDQFIDSPATNEIVCPEIGPRNTEADPLRTFTVTDFGVECVDTGGSSSVMTLPLLR